MNRQLLDVFRRKIQDGPVFGPFMKTGDPAFVEAAGYAGCDFAILDMEHGPTSLQEMQNNIRAAQVSGMVPIVRVPSLSETAISQALDIGAAGVQIPQISTAEDAQEAVRAARYYPQGERGVCRFVRAAHYSSLERSAYFAEANQSLVIIQLEGRQAVENLEGILNVDGVDILFIGPYDLSQSLGVPGQTTHPRVLAQMSEIVSRAKEKGVVLGTFTDSAETMKTWMEAGVRYLSYSVDVGIFSEACSGIRMQFDLLRTAQR
ncbi:MAG: HpcH/HpaI aldolase family protein [Candidatus Merdivicinus sp.]|jgi:4-hydroxy-2-oxoheptanedioate aldolase